MPPKGSQPVEAFTEVPFPPPPGRVEYVPEKPRSTATWIDGQYRWQAGRWQWEHGGWYDVPPGVGYATWETRRRTDGRLLYAPGTWRAKNGKDAPEPVLLAQAAYSLEMLHRDAGQIADASGEPEPFDAPTMFDGELYDAAILDALPMLEEAAAMQDALAPPSSIVRRPDQADAFTPIVVLEGGRL